MKEATKAKRTHKQRFKLFLRILLIIILILAMLGVIFATISHIGIKSNEGFIENIAPVEYENQLTPEKDQDGSYYFSTDRDFKIVQLTDVHIGAGFMSINKDTMALNAVAAMLTEEKPDLVIVTGDIAFPVPFQAGTFNNKNSARLFAQLMEQLGIYWCPVYGNHDTEAYSFYSREDISQLYESEDYPHCLFSEGPKEVDGCGNYFINVKNTAGDITQTLFMLDSHSYLDGDIFGIMWNYDCIHENQIEWYKNEVERLTQSNNGIQPKSLTFCHMPPTEYRTAWFEYADNNFENTDDVTYYFGKVGESGAVICDSKMNYGFFDTALELGSTQGMFCGHDHLNNFSLDYKGIRLTYGYSVDYLAYSGIMKYGSQRGCTVITTSPDGSFDCYLENYYQDKYRPVNEKEQVTMEDYNSPDN